MAKYLKNVVSYEDLKNKYRDLLKKNHPDNGGNLETMQEINCEYDALFKIWKDKAIKDNTLTEEEKSETARSTKRTFYSAYGWEGSRYDSNLTLKEIAKIVRAYVKEKYPTTKWSIRTHYASMCQSLSVDLLEFPERMYKTAEELKDIYYDTFTYTDKDGNENESQCISDTLQHLFRIYRVNDIFTKDSWTQEEFLQCYHKTVFEEKRYFYGVTTEYFQSVIDDVNAFISSYNYDDSDSMTDYFDVNFYDGKVDYSHCELVPKTARIKEQKAEIKTTETKTEKTTSENLINCEPFKIEESEHTQTHEKIWLVKVLKSLSKNDYQMLNSFFKSNGGYYSKFTHSFIFKYNPSEFLQGVRIW